MDRVNTLLAAGFSPDEVGEWSTQQRDTLGAAGFPDPEIDEYLGNRPKPVPPALLNRLEWGKTLSQSLKPLGDALDMLPPVPIARGIARGLVKGAFTNDEPAKAAGILDALGRVPEDMSWFVGRQVRHMFEGIPTPETAQRIGEGRGTPEEIVNMAAAALFTAGPVTRLPGGLAKVQRGPMGEVTTVPIGELPKAEDFAAARAAVTDGVPAPQVHAKIERLYDEYGIHPSEVAADAARDVTIKQDLLAGGDKLPEVYVKNVPPTEAATPPPAQRQAAEAPALAETAPAAPAELPLPDAAPQPGLFRRLVEDERGAVPLGRPDPPRTDAERSILSRLSIGETDTGRPWSWSSFYTAVVERLDPIRDLVREAAPGAKLATADDPYELARLYAGVSGKADHFLTYGTFDFTTYQTTGKGLKDIIAPAADDLDGFRAFGTSLRALELDGRGIKTGMDMDAARTVATEGQAKYAPIMAELVQYQNKLAIYLRDAGVLSREGYTAMRKENQLYLPFQRVFGEVAGDIVPDVIRGQGNSLQASNPIHAIKGSERIVVDPLESIVRNTYLSLAMAERNAVGITLVDLIQRAGGLPVPRRADTISIYRNGVKEEHTVSADLAAAIKGLDEETANTLLRMMGAPARALRAGATLTPEFMLRNPIRDFFGAVVNTTKGVFSPVDTAKGLVSAIMKDADFQNWLKAGGANSALVSFDRRYLQQNMEQLTADTGLGTRAWNVVRHPIDTLRTISEISEQATRLGEFKGVQRQQLAAGASAKEAAQAAAYSSREVTVDFARRGAKTRAMNMITAFWNAGLQGTDRTVRAFRDHPATTSFKMAAGITVPSMLLWWANHDDPRWKEVPGWQRDLFWLVMTDNHIFRIPKPPGIGQMFGSSAEHLMDAYFDSRPDALKAFGKSMTSMVAMSFVPTFAAPVIEQWANRSTFTERTLIPADLEKQLPEYQYTPYTTEAAKALGQIIGAFPGIKDAKLSPDSPALGGVARALSTPILMENYVRAWTGGLGTYALQIADAGLRKSGVLPDPVKPEDTLADIPFVKAFVVRYPSGSAESIQRFYDEHEKNKRYFDTWMAKAQEGDVIAMQHIQDMGGPRIFVQFDAIKEAVGEHSKLIRAIYKDPAMSANDKRQLIDQLYYSEIQVAQAGIGAMRQVSAALAP